MAHASSNKRLSTAQINLQAGSYTVSFYAKAATSAGADIKPGYATLSSSNANYNYGDYASSALTLGTSWQQVSYDFTLETAQDVAIVIMNYKNGAGDFLIDDVTLTLGEGGGSDEGGEEGEGEGEGETETLEYDCSTANFSQNFGTDEATLDNTYFEDYGVVYIDAENDDYALGLEFNIDALDDTSIIPAGTYQFATTYAAGTVTASTGVDSDGYITYSYAASLDSDGYVDDVWYIVSGTATVSYANDVLTIVVNGKNSYGKTIKSTITCNAENSGGSEGGSELYSIDFTSDQGEWTIENKTIPTGLTYVWKQDTTYGMKASAYLKSTSYEAESWLISPTIDLTDAEDPTLSFSQALNKGTNEVVAVLVSEDGNTWNELDIEDWPAGTDWNFITSTVSLNEYAGTEIQLAFKYASTTSNCPTWEIKTLEITDAESEDDPFEYDESESDFDATFVYGTDEIVIYTDYLADYGVVDLEGMTADGEKYVDIEFNLTATDAETILPVGTYPINNTATAGTVTASEGFYFIYDLPTFAYADPEVEEYEGEEYIYYNKVWYVVGGNVVVAKAGDKVNVTLNGTNSLGRTVQMTFTGIDPVGVEEIMVTPQTETFNSIYNISGQKIDNNYKGIIIKNGKKEFRK